MKGGKGIRGSLNFNEKVKAYFFSFIKGEPATCSGCKKPTESLVYVCEWCNRPFCYDCCMHFKTCRCFESHADVEGQFEFIKAGVLKSES